MSMRHWARTTVGFLALLALGACASGSASGRSGADVPMRVTDLKSVAGRWAGLMDLPGNRNDDQYLEVTVRENGTYEATSARQIGLLDRQGTVAVSDGRLVLKGQSGSTGTATLVSRDGAPTLMVEVTGPNQGRTTARLQPKP